MHDDEQAIDADLVRVLLTGQFPEFAGLPVRAVHSTGTVNAIFRLGDELCVRLPRTASWADDIEAECRWLPQLAPHLSLDVPEPVAKGAPVAVYPYSWAIYRWIDAEPYSDELVTDERQAAKDLAQFIAELRAIEIFPGAPRGGRRPLGELDEQTRSAIEAGRGVIDSDAAAAAWVRALTAPVWTGTPVWIHADLMQPNLLVADGVIQAVIDFGSVGVGDPAADVIPAWEVFRQPGRETFRAALDVDDGTWQRARGYALHQAAMIIPYYRETNPEFVTIAKRTVEQVLADDS